MSFASRSRRTLAALASLALALGMPSVATADWEIVELVADPGSRWYEYLPSDVYCQVDGGPSYPGFPDPDGFYLASTDVAIGSGVFCHPYGAAFGPGGASGAIEIDMSGVTGVGTETAPITDIDIEFNDWIADNDAIFDLTYVSDYTSVTGSVTLVSGVVTSIDSLSSTATLSYDLTAFVSGVFVPFAGTFSVTAGDFDLSVAPGPTATPLGTADYEWDYTGTAIPAPEPGTGLATLCGGLTLALLKRRRSS